MIRTQMLKECPTCRRLSELLACSVTGGVHFAVEPELSSIDVTFRKRDEAGEMSGILTDLHPVDEQGCFVHSAELPPRASSIPEPEAACIRCGKNTVPEHRMTCDPCMDEIYVGRPWDDPRKVWTDPEAASSDEDAVAFLERAFRNIDLPPLSHGDLLDIADALDAVKGSRLSAEPEAVTLREALTGIERIAEKHTGISGARSLQLAMHGIAHAARAALTNVSSRATK